MGQRFDFHFTTAYRLVALPFGITPSRCGVYVDSDDLTVRFGPWRVETAIDNIAEVRLTGPYGFVKTAGPAHLSLADKGLTFGSNGERGVCMTFHNAVTGIEPTGLLRHPSLTVTVAQCARLAAVLAR